MLNCSLLLNCKLYRKDIWKNNDHSTKMWKKFGINTSKNFLTKFKYKTFLWEIFYYISLTFLWYFNYMIFFIWEFPIWNWFIIIFILIKWRLVTFDNFNNILYISCIDITRLFLDYYYCIIYVTNQIKILQKSIRSQINLILYLRFSTSRTPTNFTEKKQYIITYNIINNLLLNSFTTVNIKLLV